MITATTNGSALTLRMLFAAGLLALSLAASAAPWPRTIAGDDGSVVQLERQPTRILSTSVTVTGTLLAIDAPVVASATANNGRYFEQWRTVATQRGVGKLWPAGSIDLEAAYAAAPDLILVSAGGADSALGQLAELRAIAPTLVVDYGTRDWQSLAALLAEATGLEQHTRERIAAFEERLASVRQAIRIPDGPANIISYNGPGVINPIATASGSHAQLLTALGFSVEAPDLAWHSGLDAPTDFIRSEYEFLTRLRAPTTFLLRRDTPDIQPFMDDPVLVNLPSVRAARVYGLGRNSFRIDYYSALEIIDAIQENFGN